MATDQPTPGARAPQRWDTLSSVADADPAQLASLARLCVLELALRARVVEHDWLEFIEQLLPHALSPWERTTIAQEDTLVLTAPGWAYAALTARTGLGGGGIRRWKVGYCDDAADRSDLKEAARRGPR